MRRHQQNREWQVMHAHARRGGSAADRSRALPERSPAERPSGAGRGWGALRSFRSGLLADEAVRLYAHVLLTVEALCRLGARVPRTPATRGGAGRRERYAPRCPAPRVANAQGCEWAYTRRPHSRETSYQAPGVEAEGRRSAPLVPLYSEHFAAILFERLRRVSPLHACEALPLLLSNSRPPPPESEGTTSSEDLCRERDGGGRPSPCGAGVGGPHAHDQPGRLLHQQQCCAK